MSSGSDQVRVGALATAAARPALANAPVSGAATAPPATARLPSTETATVATKRSLLFMMLVFISKGLDVCGSGGVFGAVLSKLGEAFLIDGCRVGIAEASINSLCFNCVLLK